MEGAVIQALEDVARPILKQYLPPASCINVSRIFIEVLAYFGIEAQARAVKLIAKIKQLDLAFISGFTLEEQQEVAGRVKEFHAIREGGYEAHVVVIAGDRWLIDGTFDQVFWRWRAAGRMDSPDDEFILTVDAGREIGCYFHMTMSFELPTRADVVEVEYIELADQSFKQTPAWKPDSVDRKITGELIRATRAKLNSSTLCVPHPAGVQ